MTTSKQTDIREFWINKYTCEFHIGRLSEDDIHVIEYRAVEQLKAEMQSWMKKASEKEHTIVELENYVAREKTENHKLKSKLKIAVEALKQYGGASVYVASEDCNISVAQRALKEIGGDL